VVPCDLEYRPAGVCGLVISFCGFLIFLLLRYQWEILVWLFLCLSLFFSVHVLVFVPVLSLSLQLLPPPRTSEAHGDTSATSPPRRLSRPQRRCVQARDLKT